MYRPRRGQASAITVAILTAAVLAMAVALYGYFTSHAGRAYEQQALVSAYGTFTSSLSIHLEASYINESTPVKTGCYIVSIVNTGGEPRRVYLTVLPAARGDDGRIVLDPAASRIPFDPAASPHLAVLVFNVTDANGDGVVDIVGNGGRIIPGNPWLPSCNVIYTLHRAGAGLTLPYANVSPTLIVAGLSGPTLGEEASASGVELDSLPLWSFTIAPRDKVTLLIYVEMREEPGSLGLVTLFQFTRNYYIATITNLPVTQP